MELGIDHDMLLLSGWHIAAEIGQFNPELRFLAPK
jgi:hypothetical protein